MIVQNNENLMSFIKTRGSFEGQSGVQSIEFLQQLGARLAEFETSSDALPIVGRIALQSIGLAGGPKESWLKPGVLSHHRPSDLLALDDQTLRVRKIGLAEVEHDALNHLLEALQSLLPMTISATSRVASAPSWETVVPLPEHSDTAETRDGLKPKVAIPFSAYDGPLATGGMSEHQSIPGTTVPFSGPIDAVQSEPTHLVKAFPSQQIATAAPDYGAGYSSETSGALPFGELASVPQSLSQSHSLSSHEPDSQGAARAIPNTFGSHVLLTSHEDQPRSFMLNENDTERRIVPRSMESGPKIDQGIAQPSDVSPLSLLNFRDATVLQGKDISPSMIVPEVGLDSHTSPFPLRKAVVAQHTLESRYTETYDLEIGGLSRAEGAQKQGIILSDESPAVHRNRHIDPIRHSVPAPLSLVLRAAGYSPTEPFREHNALLHSRAGVNQITGYVERNAGATGGISDPMAQQTPIADEKIIMTMARETGIKQDADTRVEIDRAVQTEHHERDIQGRLHAETAIAKPGGQSGLPQNQISNAFPPPPPIVTGAAEPISIGALTGRANEPRSETSHPPPTSTVSENLMTLLSRIQHGLRNTVVLQLEPPELGQVVVHVHRGHEQLNASFWVESSEARTLLQAHLPALQDALTQLGLPNQQITLQVVSDNALGQLFSQSAYQQQPSPGYSSHDQGRRHGSQRNHFSFADFQNADEDYQQFVDIFI